MARRLLSLMPHRWNTYFEPMIGGGALYFAVQPKKAILGDVNEDLINFYVVLRDNENQLKKRLSSLVASRDTYYTLRKTKFRGKIQRAVRFAYLNRLAWNGLHRVNRAGVFNVPIGDRLPRSFYRPEDLKKASQVLQTADLRTTDFAETVKDAQKGDFVFFDPPYPRGARDNLGFNRYASQFFSFEHHRLLAETIRTLSRRGVFVMTTLADENQLTRIYPRFLSWRMVRTKSLISCNGNGRKHVLELVLRNY